MNLIKNGERPVFAGLELVRIIYRDKEKSNNEYDTITSSYIIQMISSLYTVGQILFDRNNANNKNRNDLWRIVSKLPLFFDTEMTIKWEKEKKWYEFINHKPFIISYEEALAVFNPSDAYQINTDYKNFIWSEWFQKTKSEELINILELSAKKLLDWESERPESVLFQNINLLSETFSLPKESSKYWAYLYALTKEKNEIWDLYLSESKFSYPENYQSLVHVWEKSLGLTTNSIMQIYYPESPWVKVGFYKPYISHYDLRKFKNIQEINENLNGYRFPLLDGRVFEPEKFLKLFIQQFNGKNLPIENWNYLEELPQINFTLQNKIPLKVLIYGEKGIGKTLLVNSLLEHHKLLGFSPIQIEKPSENEDFKVLNLLVANFVTKNIAHGVLVLDEVDNHYNLIENTKKLMNLDAPIQFWITSDLKKFNEKIMDNFNIIIELNEPPLEFKKQITNQYFQDDNLATRVAQSVKRIEDIKQIAYWCNATQDFSWKNISTHISNISKAKNILKNPEKTQINLNRINNNVDLPDLAGYEDLTHLMNKLVYFFKNPNEYSKLGAPSPKGLLLTGAPGTGKTHFARYLSKITDIPMFAPNSSEMAKSPENISMVFREVKKYAPCILFLDEIDVLINNPMDFMTINLEKQKIINTFLTELDGISSNEGVLVIGATHRSQQIEKAAIRSGRISETFHIPEPNRNARLKIWEAHLIKKKISNVNYDLLATASAGFTGADIAEAANRGAIDAVEKAQNSITTENLLKACDDVFWGSVSHGTVLTEEQKTLTAYHEAGHALLAWKNNLIVQRITIKPRSQALGAVHYVNEEGIYTISKESILGRIEMMLAGICAEKVKFSYYENGGVSDLKAAKKLLHHAILEAGLGQSGAIFASDPKMWSNERKLALEQEETELMHVAFNNVEIWITNNLNLLDELASELLDKKEISGEQLNYFKQKVHQNIDGIIKKTFVELENRILHND